MRIFQRRIVRNAVLVAGVTAVVGGGALALQQTGSEPYGHAAPTGVTAQDASISTDALQCDQQEFAVLEQNRLTGKTDNQVQLSATCTIVNKRVAAGDTDVDEDLATACRNRELFAIQTDVSNESGSGNRLTSMCVGKNKLDKTEDGAPDFEKDACSDKPFGRTPLPVPEEVEQSPAPQSSPSGAVSSPDAPANPTGGNLSFDAATKCPPIREALKQRQSFDAQIGEACVTADADPGGTGRPTTLGDTCAVVDGLAHEGDLDVPVNVVLACEKVEETVFANPEGTLDLATGICKAARKQQSNGTTIDPVLAQVCAGEPA
jgi:hypothetical protein